MKDFMFIFRGSMFDAKLGKPSPEQIQSQMSEWNTWMAGIAKEGKLISGQPLAMGGKHVNGPARKLTDGPFIEGKDIVGGYLLVKADHLDEAVEISKGCPILKSEDGSVEVREILAVPII